MFTLNEYNKNIGNRVKELRDLSDITLQDFAEELDIDETMSALAMEQLMASKSQLNETICKRLQNHVHFIDKLPEEKKLKCYSNTRHNFLVKTRQETEIKIDYIGRIEKENNCINVIYET